jgi:spermidine/putrescine transport system substrate-binding protein
MRCTTAGWTGALWVAAMLSWLAQPADAAGSPELRIYNWEYFLDPELAAEFGRRHRVAVRQSFFDSDWERDLRLAAGGRADFDLVMVDAAQVSVYRARGWLEPIGVDHVPDLARLDARWRNVSEATATHAMPFAWGTLGIAYRSDLLKLPPDSWMVLFRPAGALCGKILLGDDARELLAVALKAAGHSANATDAGAYHDAEQLLQGARRCVARYRNPGVDADSDLLTGTAWAAMGYSSDTAWVHAQNPAVRFVLPREGGLIWADYLVILSSSPHKSLAYAFLQFLAEPAIAARAAAYSKAATPNAGARALLPAPDRADAATPASDRALRASEMVRNPPPAVMSLRNQIFARTVRRD